MKLTGARNIAGMIDHTDLRPEATAGDIKKLCRDALKYKFYSVCVNPCRVSFCAKLLKNSGVKVCTVIGFPLGGNEASVKAFEAQRASASGADEVDMVMNIGAFKSKDYKAVVRDIKSVKKFSQGAVVKVIVESCLLSRTELNKALSVVIAGGADYIKTSTGFSKAGASVDDVKFLKKAARGRVKIKAAGGIRDYKAAKNFIQAGADRIGTSKSVEIIEECS